MKRQVQIKIYSGLLHRQHLYVYGRVLAIPVHKPIRNTNWASNLMHNMDLLLSKEIGNVKLTCQVGNNTIVITANSEGYFRINEHLKEIPSDILMIKIDDVNTDKYAFSGTITYPLYQSENKLGVISDIDDTILHTNVLSKTKLFFNSFLLHASQRRIVANTNTWYQKLHQKGMSLFYISNSPWNFFDNLHHFINKNKFPDGPIFLRDFGLKKADSLQSMMHHKKNEILQLMDFYPHKEWILIGDGGEKDAAIYVDVYKMKPEKVKAIFIRRLGNEEHQSKINHAMIGYEHVCYFIESAEEGMRICEGLVGA